MEDADTINPIGQSTMHSSILKKSNANSIFNQQLQSSFAGA
jgi:hypothetical protein